ncbi:DUF1015 domain-containing protein [Desulfatirhabdium butyrativorans]|uniref:DUF1015 domain-containing protein n=1 Tax=Desulfatirhabdium butyrativorans TaxID=340467 RepID=UPI000401F856|nr:DUF1015 domain-containing protein [Desulfatirhabdium butyrativorans]
MANIQPIRAIVYNVLKVPDISAVVTPPYDVISAEERDAFHQRDPHNIIRLILGKPYPTDTLSDNPHTRAAATLRQWLDEGILVREPSPTIYLTAIDFETRGKRLTRWGFIAGVQLEPFEKGIVLPHETTFSRVKSERLGLIQACNANLSPIFSIYSDPQNRLIENIRSAIAASNRPEPDIAFMDSEGQGHRVWKLTDPGLQQLISDHLKECPVLIADGHHRYETALQYRDMVLCRHPEYGKNHPVNFVMMYLTAMEAPGLVVLPAHRMVHRIDPERLAAMLEMVRPYFRVEEVEAEDLGPEGLAARLEQRLLQSDTGSRIGLIRRDHPRILVLELKPGVMKKRYGDEFADTLLDLDVTVLTRLLLMDILGLNSQDLDDEARIRYSKSASQAMASVFAGRCDLAFILNPTRVDQVRRAAAAGQIMPRKSTYFYPKVITGLALHPLWENP